MPKRITAVITTIGNGNFIPRIAAAFGQEGMKDRAALVVIPDRKTPAEIFDIAKRASDDGFDVECPTVPEQEAFLRDLGAIADLIPYDSDNRRNIGYLRALADGADVIVSMDDDNFPAASRRFFADHAVVGTTQKLPQIGSSSRWYNICSLLDVDPPMTFPRGFPYRHRTEPLSIVKRETSGLVKVNAGLWTGHPDVDAVSCLAGPLNSKSFKGESVFLGPDAWSPINSQNTAVSRDAMAAYYFARMGFPIHGQPIDRDGDIFSGYFLQACVHHLKHKVRVGTPIASHERNVHNYLEDLKRELPCIEMLEDITEWLANAVLDGKNYRDSYLSLADNLERQAQKFRGTVWDEASRGYIHRMAYCMRAWIDAVERACA